LIIDNFPN